MKKNKVITNEELLITIKNTCPNAIIFEGFNDCIIGINISLPNKTNVVYSRILILNKLICDGYEVLDAIVFYEKKISNGKFDISVEPHFIEEFKFEYNPN
jgi:hypothetical protein